MSSPIPGRIPNASHPDGCARLAESWPLAAEMAQTLAFEVRQGTLTMEQALYLAFAMARFEVETQIEDAAAAVNTAATLLSSRGAR